MTRPAGPQGSPHRDPDRGARWAALDRGVSTIEAAIVIPVVVFVVIFGSMQAALWFHGRNVAAAAAQVGAQAARTYDGSAGTGHSAATGYLASVTGLEDATVSIDRGPDTTTVVVTGTTPQLVPGMPRPVIEVTSQAATERLTG